MSQLIRKVDDGYVTSNGNEFIPEDSLKYLGIDARAITRIICFQKETILEVVNRFYEDRSEIRKQAQKLADKEKADYYRLEFETSTKPYEGKEDFVTTCAGIYLYKKN